MGSWPTIHGSNAHRVRPKFIADYIRKATSGRRAGQLDCPPRRQQDRHPEQIGAYKPDWSRGSPSTTPAAGVRYQIKRVLSPSDESTDLDDLQKSVRLQRPRSPQPGKRDKNGNPARCRRYRPGQPLRRAATHGPGTAPDLPAREPTARQVGRSASQWSASRSASRSRGTRPRPSTWSTRSGSSSSSTSLDFDEDEDE